MRWTRIARETIVADGNGEGGNVAFGVPSRLRGPAIDAYLDKISGRSRFTDLAQAVQDANDKASLVAAARALHDWQKEKGK